MKPRPPSAVLLVLAPLILVAACGLLHAGEDWYFLPNFRHDIRSIETPPDEPGRFHESPPAAIGPLWRPDSGLAETERQELFWHPATFPHRDFVGLMPQNGVFGWYACEFDIAEELDGLDVIADLGIIDDTDEAFVNGHRVGGVGQIGQAHSTAWQTDRLYRVPADCLTGFFNYLAVHVWSLWGLGGIVGPPVLKAAVAPADSQWELAFVRDGDAPRHGLDDARTADEALALLSAARPLEWQAVPMPWSGYAAWADDCHYAVFRLAFDLCEQDGASRRFSSPVVMDAGPVFDVAAFYLNGRRIARVGRFPEDGEPAFTEAAARAQFLVRPEDWAEDGQNELVAVVHRERGVGGLPGIPGILLSSPLSGHASSFAGFQTALNVCIQSDRLEEAGKRLSAARPSNDTERAWLLSHQSHLAFLEWHDADGGDPALLDRILAPVAEILSRLPAEAPKQSAMQGFCRVLRRAEKDENLRQHVKKHFPCFASDVMGHRMVY